MARERAYKKSCPLLTHRLTKAQFAQKLDGIDAFKYPRHVRCIYLHIEFKIVQSKDVCRLALVQSSVLPASRDE